MEQTRNKPIHYVTYGAAIAAVYIVLTIVFAPISFGPVQFRISEILCVLPFFTPAAVPVCGMPSFQPPLRCSRT